MPLAMKRLIKLRGNPYRYSTNLRRYLQNLMKMREIGPDRRFQISKHGKTHRIKLQYMTKEQLALVNLSLNRASKIRNMPLRNETQLFLRIKAQLSCLKIVQETRKIIMKMTFSHRRTNVYKKTAFLVFKRNLLI